HPDRREAATKEMERLVNATCDTVIEPVGGDPVRLGDLAAASIDVPTIEAFQFARRQQHERRLSAQREISALTDAHLSSGRNDPLVLPDELVKQARVAAVSPKAGRVATNRMLTRLKHLYRWAIRTKLVSVSPFLSDEIQFDKKAEGPRSRRLEG